MEATRDEILEVVRQYRELPADYMDITDLMHKRKMLSTLGVTFSVQVGQARAKWKRATFRYEVERNQKQINFYSKQGNLGKAEIYAKANTEDLYEKSIEAENVYFELDYIFKAVRETMGELNQRISYLREELKQERFFND